MSEIVTIEVSVTGYGSARFSHRSASAAFASAWRAFRSARDCTFKEFMKLAQRRKIDNPPGVGEPIRVMGRNAWMIDPHDHSPAFIYADGGPILRAHHGDVEKGHTKDGESSK